MSAKNENRNEVIFVLFVLGQGLLPIWLFLPEVKALWAIWYYKVGLILMPLAVLVSVIIGAIKGWAHPSRVAWGAVTGLLILFIWIVLGISNAQYRADKESGINYDKQIKK
jgi:hypothetical protein